MATKTHVNPDRSTIEVPDCCQIGAGVLIRADVKIGQNCVIGDNVTIDYYTVIGSGVIIKSGVFIKREAHISSGVIIPENWLIPGLYIVNPHPRQSENEPPILIFDRDRLG